MSGYWNQQVIIISGIIFQEDMLRTDVWSWYQQVAGSVVCLEWRRREVFFFVCDATRVWHATRVAVARRSHFQCVS